MTPHNGITLFIISVLYVTIYRKNVPLANLHYRILEHWKS